MMEVVHLTQRQLTARWSTSEATLERWRSAGIGPPYLKLMGQVRYRLNAGAESTPSSTSFSRQILQAGPISEARTDAACAHDQSHSRLAP